jgi:hypothetical protein
MTALVLVFTLAQVDLGGWTREPADWKGLVVDQTRATLPAADGWSHLRSPEEYQDVEISATFTVLEPAGRISFKGSDWCVWTDFGYADQGYDFALLLRHSGKGVYRVQVSHKFQEVTLFKHPHGSFLRVAPCALKLNAPHRLAASVQGNEIVVSLDGREMIRYRDSLLAVDKGALGLATSSLSKVAVEGVQIRALPPAKPAESAPHEPDLAVREWRGRSWIFDGQEPILLLFTTQVPHNQNAKLKPGYKPVLMWNAYWDIQCQGAYAEGTNRPQAPRIERKGEALEIRWDGRHEKECFTTKTAMTVAYDRGRDVYTYDVESELAMLPGKEFHFRQGFDFEHHTGLDPFRWEYMVLRGGDGRTYYRPFFPFDPGGCEGLATRSGFRAWVGRRGEPFVVGPAVEYQITEPRSMNTAVCAWAYDTGVAFPPETLKDGAKMSVRYRYTGYPAGELKDMLAHAEVWPLTRLDPRRHFIFAESWPKLDFSQSAALNESWSYGRTPFMSGHNALPQYALEKYAGGSAMRLGPSSYAAANLPAPSPLPKGKYVVTVRAKGVNLYGPGAYVEVLGTKDHTLAGYVRHATKVLAEERHYVGNGTFDWKTAGFVTEIPGGAPHLAIGLGNAGTGDVLFTDLEIQPWKEGLAFGPANAKPAALPGVPRGAIADYRMEEGSGLYVLDAAGGSFGNLQLANAGWVKDGNRPALRLHENKDGREEFPAAGSLDLSYFSHKSYTSKRKMSLALAGMHGGGGPLKAFSVRTSVKPGDSMSPAYWGSDILGLGARSLKIVLKEPKPPYTLGVSLGFADWFWTESKLEAGRWYDLAVTGVSKGDEKLKIRIYVDGKLVKEDVSAKFTQLNISPSLVLGTELFYFEGAYRGLIGHTTVFDRALTADDLK